MNKVFKRCFLLLAIPVFLFSCKQEILDFFEAIQDYGYRSLQPLGPKNVPVNDNLLGGYVYDGLPVIISKKDANTYQIKFLSVLLHKEDAVADAHATQIGTATFLNLAMGDYYCFMRVNLMMNTELQIELLKDALKEYVPANKIKAWLEKNPDATSYTYTDAEGTSYDMDIFFSFIFQRVTVDEALRMQQEKLRYARQQLFEECDSYFEYEDLVHRFPNDEFRELAEFSIFNRCERLEEFKEFISYFPDSQFRDEAEAAIKNIIETERLAEFLAIDQQNFQEVIAMNTRDAYKAFADSAYTNAYRDSAMIRFGNLAAHITQDEVEWKWTNGEPEAAFDLLFLKVDYLKNRHEIPWIVDHFTLYALQYNKAEMTEKVLTYFDKFVARGVFGDDFLDIYLNKGFLQWSLNDVQDAVATFDLKLNHIYEKDGSTFKENIKLKYKWLCEQGITFPDQKANWKRIKKLKSDF